VFTGKPVIEKPRLKHPFLAALAGLNRVDNIIGGNPHACVSFAVATVAYREHG